MAHQTRGYAHRVDLRADIADVWQSLIEPARLARWCAPQARVDARQGGSFWMQLDADLTREAHIDIYQPPRRLRLIYMPPPGQPVRNLLGGNASFRREVFDQVGGFTSDAGRSVQAGRPAARLPLGCEETEFCIKIGQQLPDSRLIIDDRAVIWHRVPDQRARLRYFVTRCYAEGLSKAVVTRRVGSADGLAAERRHAFATLPAGLARCLRESARGDLAGIGRAGAIIAGLSATTAGYLAGRLTGR